MKKNSRKLASEQRAETYRIRKQNELKKELAKRKDGLGHTRTKKKEVYHGRNA